LPCEIPVNLLYVSPTQINFVVPDISVAAYGQLSVGVVLIRDGQRFGTFGCIDQHCLGGPGLFGIVGGGSENTINSAIIFIAGYDCLFSLSLMYPSDCGFSWYLGVGQARSWIGAVTDSSGTLITSENPVHEGQLVTLWMTGLTGLTQNPTTGLLEQASPSGVSFGVLQYGVFNTLRQTPIWAGQSPQYVGLDQVNVAFPFPACANQVKATAEKRYDAYLAYEIVSVSGGTEMIYIPF
jgi:hypothetical protein